MPYASLADLKAAYGERELNDLLDRGGDGMHDPGVLAAAQADVDAEIDGYLAGRYRLPLDPVPRIMVRIACDIMRYRLWSEAAPEMVRERYQDARRLLEAIAAGRVRLGAPAPEQEGLTGGSMEVAPATRPRDWGMLA